MQHIPLPRDPAIKDIAIPLLCHGPYDGGEFLTYPERQCWTVKVVLQDVIFTHNGDVVRHGDGIAPFIQSWLYFGVMNEVIGHSVDQSDFQSVKQASNAHLTSAPLERHVVEWVQSFRHRATDMSRKDIIAWRDRLQSCFQRVGAVLYASLAYQKHHPEHHSPLLARVWLGIALLVEYLDNTVRLLGRELNVAFDPLYLRPINLKTINPDVAQPIIDALEQRGWCRRMLNHIQADTNLSLAKLWFCANLNPPNEDKSHLRCTDEICQAQQVDKALYRTHHMREDCCCDDIGPDTRGLKTITERDQTALVTVIVSETDAHVNVSMNAWTPGTRYVAISHVWSDGHGNLGENALPICVLLYIQKCVNAAAKEQCTADDDATNTPFWMDTLCIPRKPNELRQRGIALIPQAFRNAETVLVLDAYLEKVPCKLITSTEILARIALCPWTQRLWTAAEGLLARDIRVQFADCSLELAEFAADWSELSGHFPPTMKRLVFREVMDIYVSNRGMSYSTDHFTSPSIYQLRYGLRMRSTSWSFDEPICLALLFDLDVATIVQSDHVDKMAVFWKLLGELPRSLAFSTAKKLTQKGFRWAPASFMGDLETTDWSGPRELADGSQAKVTPEGLEVRLPALVFKPSICKKSVQSKQRMTEYMLCLNMEFVLKDQHGVWYECDALQQWNENTEVSWPVEGDPAILLETPPSTTRQDLGTVPAVDAPHIKGVIVSIKRTEISRSTSFCRGLALAGLSFMCAEETEYWNELEGVAQRIISDAAEEVDQFRSSSKGVIGFVARCVEQYDVGLHLLQLSRQLFEAKGWPFGHDIMSWQCYRKIAYLVLVGDFYRVTEETDMISWCID